MIRSPHRGFIALQFRPAIMLALKLRSLAWRMSTSSINILTYHNIGMPPPGAAQPWLYVRPEAFERQMWMLNKLGIQGVSVTEGLRRLQSGDASRSVVITFDDGYADNLQYAAPILAHQGFSSTCYVVSNYIGSYNTWDAETLRVRKPLMRDSQLQSWLNYGMEIGSHSRSHPRLDLLTSEEQLVEIVASRDQLRSITGREIDHFCYPYGRFDATTAALVKQAGYRSATSTIPGLARASSDVFRLPRNATRGDESSAEFLLRSTVPIGWLVSNTVRRAWRRLSIVSSPACATGSVD